MTKMLKISKIYIKVNAVSCFSHLNKSLEQLYENIKFRIYHNQITNNINIYYIIKYFMMN